MASFRCFVIFLFLLSNAFGQQQGMPYYRFYDPQEFQAHRQNWTVDQANDGTLYFANTKGLLVYNGESWSLERLPNLGHIRSLKIVGDKIYVGANNELGYFQNDKGSYKYHSFLEHVPKNLMDFGRVWTTLVDGNDVYFQTDTFVMRIGKDNKSKFWTFDQGRIWKLISQNKKLYLIILESGLFELNENDVFINHPFSAEFKYAGSEFLLPISGGWVFEKSDVLNFFNGTKSVPFENEASQIFEEYGINTAILSSSGKIIVATLRKGGVVILDQNGRLERHLNSENGFTNNIVRGVFEDRQNAIWFTLENGLSRLDIDSPISFFDERMGLNGTIMDIQLFKEKLYVATSDGLMVMNRGKFERVNDIKSMVWDLDTLQNQMLAVTSFDDTYAVDKFGNTTSLPHQKSLAKDVNRRILPLKENSNSAVILFHTGIFQIYWDGSEWVTEDRLEGLFISATGLEQPKPGVFWIATNTNGLYQIKYNLNENGIIDKPRVLVKNYQKDKGVPEGYNKIFSSNQEFYFQSSKDKFYHYDSEADSFKEEKNIGRKFNINYDSLSLLRTELNGKIWFSSEKKLKKYLYKVERKNNKYSATSYPLSEEVLRIRDPFSTIEFYTSGEQAFFGGSKGLVSYEFSKLDNITNNVSIQINNVKTKDSVFGYPSGSNKLLPLAHNNSEIRFEFASANHKDSEHKQYQYFLEGLDSNWSEARPQNYVEYTSLPPGDYTFKVKALNDYFFESPEASIQFTVGRPWYWNSISIPLYVLALGLFTYLFSQWRNKNLKLKNLRLEEAVNNAVAETKRQAEEITELYEVKNQFFSNISHELRTPLTLILGPSTDMVDDDNLTTKQKNELTFINNNAKRLLRLINQLLDLSKLEAGKLDLRVSQQNIIKFIATITESFDSMAVSQNIRLKFKSTLQELFVFFDQDKLEQVLINLLSNALKFTKAGGKVSVLVEKKENLCEIQVADTGIGVNEEQLPYIFDRFYQADNSESREHEGTGIGLSLTKELVELHGGTIEASSIAGQGSVFTINLPLGKEHFDEHQLAKLKPTPKDISAPKMQALVEENHNETSSVGDEVVLLVEDNTEMRTYIKGLIWENYSILEAANGLEGLKIAKEEVPDLIISDVMMPKMDGAELCKKLKNNEITSHIPVILLTAKASEEDRIKGLKIEADAYLAKPFNKEELRARVKNLILNRKKLQKRFAKSTLISPKEIAVTSMEQQFLEKLVNEIEDNIADEAFSVEQLAMVMNLSRSQLHRKMISITDQPPSLFIRKYRLERAKQFLEKGAGRVSDIAFKVGFSSPSYFTKCFVEEFGQTPKEVSKSGD